jgi:hypothetical protein
MTFAGWIVASQKSRRFVSSPIPSKMLNRRAPRDFRRAAGARFWGTRRGSTLQQVVEKVRDDEVTGAKRASRNANSALR